MTKTSDDFTALYSKALRELRDVLRAMKKDIHPKDFNPDKVARTDVRIGHVDEKTVERFVVHFRSTGCLWDKRAGGCTMCGFWDETAQFKRAITHRNFVNQFVDLLQTYDLRKYPVLSLYNAGSFLVEQEIPFSAVEEIMAADHDGIARSEAGDHREQGRIRGPGQAAPAPEHPR